MIGTVLVLGGGGFSTLDEASAIDDYLLGLSATSDPKVCFVPTASGDADPYIESFISAFQGRAQTSVLLAVWRLHGLPDILRTAASNGTILAGISAGMNCWFDASSTDSYGPLAPLPDGLGFLPGSACPHYLEEPDRRDKYLGWVASGAMPGGYAVDQHAALLFRDGRFVEAIAEVSDHPAYRVERGPGGAHETELPVRLLA